MNSQHPMSMHRGVPIIGDQSTYPEGPNTPGLTAACEIYDTEIDQIQKVLEALNDYIDGGKRRVDRGLFDRQIVDRFAEIGFKVVVDWNYTDHHTGSPEKAEMLMPTITISDRIEKQEFDYDRMVHEVTNDVLGLGEGGVIKSDGVRREQGHGHAH